MPGCLVLLFLALAGCHEPNYRTEVVGNGQGGVEIHRVPKDPAEETEIEARPKPATTSPSDASRLDALEQRIRQQDHEIAKLKRQLDESSTTKPTTTAP